MAEDSIAIDHEVLVRSAATLHRTADALAAVSKSIAGAQMSANAFGAMNSWMAGPVNALSNSSIEHIRIAGNVVEVVGVATDSAADDFESTEGDVLLWVTQLDEQLTAGLAPVARPAPSPPAPQPVPSPSPNPAPTSAATP